MAKTSVLTAARLREMLHYDPETGQFRWIKRKKGRRVAVGSFVHTKQRDNHIRVKIDYVTYNLHRLAWLWMTGDWPQQNKVIDHINRDPSDNRWSNLRLVTHSENSKNKIVRNKSGFKGVFWSKNKWQSSLYLGSFTTKEEACEAYEQARRLVGWLRTETARMSGIPQKHKKANRN